MTSHRAALAGLRWPARALACAFAVIALCSSAPPAAVAAPFACSTSTVLVSPGNPSQLTSVVYAPGTALFSPIGPPFATYNAMGFNPVDRFAYAISGTPIIAGAPGTLGEVVRIDDTGTVTPLGANIAPPGGLNIGAFDAAGTYYATSTGNTTMYVIDVGPPVPVIAPIAFAGTGVADFTLVGGDLWGKAGATFSRVDLPSLTVTNFPQTIMAPAIGVGAAWTFGNGNLGMIENATGTVFQVRIDNPASATPSFTLLSTSAGPPTPQIDGTSCIGPPVDLSITKTAPPSVGPAGQITWTITVHNNGPGGSSGYTMTDTIPASITGAATVTPGCTVTGGTLTCTQGPLDAGEDSVITLTGTAPGTAATTVENTASVTGNDVDPDPSDNTSTSSVRTRGVADLAIVKTAAPDPAIPGQNLTYTLKVTNKGPNDAANVVVKDPLPAGLTFVSASPGCSHAFGTVTCTQASLANGATATFTVVASVGATATGTLENAAIVSSDDTDPTSGDNSSTARTPVAGTADVEVTKIVNRAEVNGNEQMTWTATIVNRGPNPATGVVLVDEPSLPVTFSSVTSTVGTCTTVVPVRCTIGTLAVGQTVTVTLVGRATVAGALRNVARVTAAAPTTDPQPADNVAAVTTQVRGSLRIRKTANKRSVRAGGSINYRIRVDNASSVKVQNVRVCDRLPSGLSYISSSPRATRSEGRFCWSLGTLAAKSSRQVRVTVRALRGTRGRRTNTATVTGRGASARSDASPAVNVLAAGVRGGGVTG